MTEDEERLVTAFRLGLIHVEHPPPGARVRYSLGGEDITPRVLALAQTSSEVKGCMIDLLWAEVTGAI